MGQHGLHLAAVGLQAEGRGRAAVCALPLPAEAGGGVLQELPRLHQGHVTLQGRRAVGRCQGGRQGLHRGEARGADTSSAAEGAEWGAVVGRGQGGKPSVAQGLMAELAGQVRDLTVVR